MTNFWIGFNQAYQKNLEDYRVCKDRVSELRTKISNKLADENNLRARLIRLEQNNKELEAQLRRIDEQIDLKNKEINEELNAVRIRIGNFEDREIKNGELNKQM